MLRRLPRRAQLVDEASGQFHKGPRAGQAYTVRRYIVPTEYRDGGAQYVTIDGPEVSRCYRYTGRNADAAPMFLSAFRAATGTTEIGSRG